MTTLPTLGRKFVLHTVACKFLALMSGQGRGTYFEVYNEKVDPDSALAPFRNGNDKYWDSSQTRFLDPSAVAKCMQNFAPSVAAS
jgi:hypothetical protein